MYIFGGPSPKPDLTIVIHPALGVKASYYFGFAQELSKKYTVVIGEHRGNKYHWFEIC